MGWAAPRARVTVRDQAARRSDRSVGSIPGRRGAWPDALPKSPSRSCHVHQPIWRPARWAAPSADRLAVRPTRTGRPLRSACSCIRGADFVIPPSVASSASGPVTSAKACRTSSTWKAMDSNAARARFPRRVPSENPVSRGTASRSHHGAPRPPKAGTSVTPSLALEPAQSKTRSTSTSSSSASQVSVRPVERMLASRARATSSTCHAIVAQTPEAPVTRGPRAMTDEPVP